ncbi:hypothetical protein CoNPh17_CDS0242 [Staphylococcus phage S-CoN_Ph17]|nr:hypothetical protein CoNPh17_CDS0242 [Staphylococcus phage S-CoN_Ph17]
MCLVYFYKSLFIKHFKRYNIMLRLDLFYY